MPCIRRRKPTLAGSDRLLESTSAGRRFAPRSTADAAMTEPTATPPWPRHAVTSASTPRICLSVKPIAPPAISQLRITPRRIGSGSAASTAVSSPSAVAQVVIAWSISESISSVSSRNAVAVRASASATPPPSTSSISGSTSWRSRVRVKRRSLLCGSCQASSPSSAQAACVTSRRTPSSGRHQGGSYGAHAGDRPGTGAAAQPEQHGLGLVVEGVRQQHRRSRRAPPARRNGRCERLPPGRRRRPPARKVT